MNSAVRLRSRSDGLGAYFLLTFAISWTCWGTLPVLDLAGGSVHPSAAAPPAPGLILLGLGALAPAIASVFMTWRTSGVAGLWALWRRTAQFDLSWQAYVAIGAVPLLASSLRVAFHLVRGGTWLASPLLAQPTLLIPFSVQVFVFGPLMEEPGWRGCALDRLLKRSGCLPASLILGGLHGPWHLPLFFVAGTVQHAWGFTAIEFALFVAAVMGGAVSYTWLHLASDGSIWAAILFHTTSNFGMSFLWTLYDGGTSDRLVMALAIAVLAAFLVRVVRPSGSGPRRRTWPGLGPAAP